MAAAKIRTELVGAIALLALGFGLLQPGLVLLSVVLVTHLAIGMGLARPPGEPVLRAGRRLSAPTLFEGDGLQIEVDLENLGPDLEVVALSDRMPAGFRLEEGSPSAIGPLPGGAKLSLRYAVRVRRGRYQLPAVDVAAGDLLGYWSWQGRAPCPETVVVMPCSQPLQGIGIGPRRTLAVPGTARARRGGSGTEWFGTREYQPGDPIRRIHRQALLRWGRLAVVEFEEEHAADVMLVLDVRRPAYPDHGAEDLLDEAARATASLGDGFLLQGHRVGLLFYGTYLNWVLPGYGRRHALRMRRELARAALGTSAAFDRLGGLPVRLLRPGSQIVLISPLAAGDEEDLARLAACGYQVMVVIPEPPSAAGGRDRPELTSASRLLALERKSMVRRLRHAHIRPVVWHTAYPLAPQLRAAWQRLPWR